MALSPSFRLVDNIDMIDMLGRKMKTKIKEYHQKYLDELDISKDK